MKIFCDKIIFLNDTFSEYERYGLPVSIVVLLSKNIQTSFPSVSCNTKFVRSQWHFPYLLLFIHYYYSHSYITTFCMLLGPTALPLFKKPSLQSEHKIQAAAK